MISKQSAILWMVTICAALLEPPAVRADTAATQLVPEAVAPTSKTPPRAIVTHGTQETPADSASSVKREDSAKREDVQVLRGGAGLR